MDIDTFSTSIVLVAAVPVFLKDDLVRDRVHGAWDVDGTYDPIRRFYLETMGPSRVLVVNEFARGINGTGSRLPLGRARRSITFFDKFKNVLLLVQGPPAQLNNGQSALIRPRPYSDHRHAQQGGHLRGCQKHPHNRDPHA